MAPAMTRRALIRYAGLGSLGVALTACQPKVIEVTKVVEKVVKQTVAVEVAKVVKETVLVQPTAAPAPTAVPVTQKVQVAKLRCTHSWPAEQWPRQVEFDNVFNKEQPNIQMTGENIVWADYVPKMTAMAAAGSLPDVLYCQYAWAQKFIMDGVVINLQPFLDKDTKFWGKAGEDFVPQALVTYRWQGNMYLIPYNEGPTNLIYYNVRLFDEAKIPYPNQPKDWTLDDLLQAAKALTKGEAEKKQWGYDGLPSMGGALNADWLYLWDAKWWSEPCETESFIHEANAIKCMQWWADLRLKHKVCPTPAELQTVAGAANPFYVGRQAMMKGASWANRSIKPNLKDPYDVAHGAKGPNGKRSSSTMGSAYAISKDCKNKDAAWEYMRSYLSTEGQIFNWSSIGIDPARWSAWPAYYTSGAVPKSAKVVEEAFKTYAVHEILDSPNGREITLSAQPFWDKAMIGEMSVDEACKKMSDASAAVMKKNADWCAKAGLKK